MGISRSIGDLLLLIPFLSALFVSVICHIIIYLFLAFGSFILFIYERLKWS